MVNNELPLFKRMNQERPYEHLLNRRRGKSIVFILFKPEILRSSFLCDSYGRLDYRSVCIVISVAYYPLSFLNFQHSNFCLRLSLLKRSWTTGITNQKNNRDPSFYSCGIMHLLKEQRPYSKKWILRHWSRWRRRSGAILGVLWHDWQEWNWCASDRSRQWKQDSCGRIWKPG